MLESPVDHCYAVAIVTIYILFLTCTAIYIYLYDRAENIRTFFFKTPLLVEFVRVYDNHKIPLDGKIYISSTYNAKFQHYWIILTLDPLS